MNNNNSGKVLSNLDKLFPVFLEKLEAALSKIRIDDHTGELKYGCDKSFHHTQNILEELGFTDICHTLMYFEMNGAYCDCEILLNFPVDDYCAK